MMKVWHKYLLVILIYAFLSALSVALMGPEPSLRLDHLHYMRVADQIKELNPSGDYWRSISAVQTYEVLLAYISDLTGDYISALKVFLYLVSVLHMVACQRLFAMYTDRLWLSALFGFLCSVHVSFGFTFFGVTQFESSVGRSIIMPLNILALVLYLKYRTRLVRYLIMPAAVLLSVIHLSVCNLVLLLFVSEFLRLIRNIRQRPYLEMAALVLSAVSSVLIYWVLYVAGLLWDECVSYVNAMVAGGLEAPITSVKAWEMERYIMPWRCFPPPLATVLASFASVGFIVAAAVAGLIRCIRRGLNDNDRIIIWLVLSILVSAYGFQIILWALSYVCSVRPFSIEEVRSLSYMAIPLCYFVFRYFQLGGIECRTEWRIVASLALCALYLIQPLTLIRVLPERLRLRIYAACLEKGVIQPADDMRTCYARQQLGLDEGEDRFYYRVKDVVKWLNGHCGRGDIVLTSRNDLYVINAEIAGASASVIGVPSGSQRLQDCLRNNFDLQLFLGQRDYPEIMKMAQRIKAKFVVLPWVVPGALFRSGQLSIVAVNNYGDLGMGAGAD